MKFPNKCILIVLMAMIISSPISAKDSKINIGILQFQHTQNNSSSQKDYTSFIEDMVTSTFVSEGRFNVVERSDLDAITAERVIQEIKNVKNASKIRDMGVSWIVVGEVSKIHVTQKRTNEGNTIYSAAIGFTLKVINVETGTIAYSKSFTNGGGKLGLFTGFKNVFADTSTPDGALAVVLKDMNKEVHNFVGKSFPIVIEIISIEKADKKGTAKEILIAGGEQDGMKKKVKLVVFKNESITVRGETLNRKKRMGLIEVIRTEGDSFSVCKVKEGAKMITSALKNNDILHAEVFVK